MAKYLLVTAIALVGIGYVIVDQTYFTDPAVADCCANDFDPRGFETTPVP